MADDAETVDLPDRERLAFERLLGSLHEDYHFDFRQYKAASLARRIRARMSQVHTETFESYLRHLERHADEATALFNTILINVTGFFRDPDAWDLVRTDVVPRLLEGLDATGSLRVWSAGCSTGEEAYTTAIVLAEALGERAGALDIKIYATDVDDDALLTARQALYRTEHLKDMPPALLERYFSRDGQLYRLRRDLRRWCIFGRHNLAQDPPLSHVDFLLCRNVLIYFKGDLQDRLLPRFHYALRDGGFLFLGKSESLMARSHGFAAVSTKWRVFQRVGDVQAPDVAVLRADVSRLGEGERGASHAEARVDVNRILDTLPYPVFLIDPSDVVRHWNESAAALYDIPASHAIGRQFRDLDLSYRAEGLRARIEDVKHSRTASRLEGVVFTRRSGERVHAEFWMVPLTDDRRVFSGILVTAADVTSAMRLRDEVGRLAEQHATAAEELQSTNEELETTNEELQSTNEELETTNEELQSTNEELMTTVDELQATNVELAQRGAELRRLALYQTSIMNSVTDAIVVMDRTFTVTSWNESAQRLWGLPADHAVGRDFFSLPIGEVTRAARSAMARLFADEPIAGELDVAFTASNAQGDRAMLLHLVVLSDASGDVQGIVATARPK
ncbi:MAG TPA: CheR family methyltransferase [Methylomirabilota bacterium]|jgi:two-component system CheB/CheR fusion protein|nr:CheR family methyltransferase [Methylomirabilota bacterium]